MNRKLSSEAHRKIVFISGDFSLESVEDKIVALGHTFQKRITLSEPNALLEIVRDLKHLTPSGDLLAVLLFLSKRILFDTSSLEYFEVWQNLLNEVKRTKSLMFIEEQNLRGVFYNDNLENLILETQNLIRLLIKHREIMIILGFLETICKNVYIITQILININQY